MKEVETPTEPEATEPEATEPEATKPAAPYYLGESLLSADELANLDVSGTGDFTVNGDDIVFGGMRKQGFFRLF